MKFTSFVFVYILLTVHFLYGDCDPGFVEINENCYWESDILILQEVININTLEIDSPIELGDQIWSEGRLEYLESNFAQLMYLPYNFGNLDELTELHLCSNQFSSLPESFGYLDNLIILDLSSNQLNSLPTGFGNLGNLTNLDLSYNQLTYLPESFGYLNQLNSLNLSDNQLAVLPSSFGNLQNLVYLYLSSNNLTYLDTDFGNLTLLVDLDLSSNQLTSLPENIGDLGNLKNLYLQINKIESLPQDFVNLDSLETAFLYLNQLISLPEDIGNLNNLKTLSVYENNLEMLPMSLWSLTELNVLKLHSNELADEIPEDICNLTNLIWSIDNETYYESSIYDNNFCPEYPTCVEDFIGEQDVSDCEIVDINNYAIEPNEFTLFHSYPNPFNPLTTISFQLTVPGYVLLAIYNINGDLMETLVNDNFGLGYHEVNWNASSFSSGIYFAKLVIGNSVSVQKLELLR